MKCLVWDWERCANIDYDDDDDDDNDDDDNDNDDDDNDDDDDDNDHDDDDNDDNDYDDNDDDDVYYKTDQLERHKLKMKSGNAGHTPLSEYSSKNSRKTYDFSISE
jgi:hypothetical protein